MGRRSDHSRDELTRLALAAAEEICRRDGPRGLTARRVAESIGYSPGTLYNLFGNLDGLILALNGRTLDRLSAALRAVPLDGEPQRDAAALLERYLDFAARDRTLWELVYEHRLPPEAEVPAWYLEKAQQALEIIAEALRPAAGPAADDAARMLWAALHGVLVLATTGKPAAVGAEDETAMARRLVRTVIAGLEAEGVTR